MNVLRRSVCAILSVVVLSSRFCAVSAPGPVVVSIGENFSGISYGSYNTNSAAIPPDSDGEIGPNHYVEFINGIFAVYDKTTGNRVELKTDVDFWGSAGVGIDVANGADVSDPRIIYDPASQRWFASQIDVNYQIDWDTLTVALGTNHFLLAVSVTADPTGQWRGTAFPTDPNNLYFGDFPTLGVDSKGVYLAADMFDANGDPTTATDLGCTLVSLSKTDLLASPPVFSNRTVFENMSFSERGQIFEPATCTDDSAVGSVLAAGDVGTDSSPHSNLVTFAVQNVTGPGAATLGASAFIEVPPYMVPDNAALGAPVFTAEQPDGTETLQANDARFCAKIYTVGGVIYGIHNTELNGRIAIRWYRIRASDGHLLESGTIADSNLDLFFPSIAANPAGTVVICYNGCGPSSYVSCYAMAGQVTSGVTTFGNPVLLMTGATSYHGDDEDTSGLGLGNPTSRWGDYSTTSVDPSDPNRFWTIQMYPSDSNVWTTQITELITTQPPPLLTIASSGTNVLVSWPSSASSFHLQATTNLLVVNSWSLVPQIPFTNGPQISVLVPGNTSSQFFRLQSP
jgi:hypothetical protein